MKTRAHIAIAGVIAASVLAIASCGSRTGLFGGDGTASLPDGSVPETTPFKDAPDDGPVKCIPGRFTFELATAQLMFVLDRSGSMAFSLNGTRPDAMGNLPPGVESRWDVLRAALFQSITPFDGQLAMGAKFYPEVSAPGPSPADEACRTDVGVGIAPARNNSASIISVFDTTTPNGGTPTSEAIRIAAQYISGTRTVAKTIIVATDGAPNCNGDLDPSICTCTSATGNNCATAPGGEYNCLDDVRTVGVVRDAFQNLKIPVYVIGIGAAEDDFRQVLNDMAVAGGRPRAGDQKHYSAQSPTELKDAFQSIGDSVAKCTYITPSAPTDPNAISVEINGKSIQRDPSHANGWDWVDQAFGALAFFGDACAAASNGGSTTPQITGVVRCEN